MFTFSNAFSNSSSSSRVSDPSSAEEVSSSQELPSFPLLELPGDLVKLVGFKIRNPLDAIRLMSTCKGLREDPDLSLCIPELIEARITGLGNIQTERRAAAAAQLAVGLGTHLRPYYLECVLNKIEIPEETDHVLLLKKEKKYIAAAVAQTTTVQDLIDAAGKELGADEWTDDYDAIESFLADVRKSFAGKERLICDCYVGLWQRYSKNEKKDAMVVDFGTALLSTLGPAEKFVRLEVLVAVATSARLAPHWGKMPKLAAALHNVVTTLHSPTDIKSDRLFIGLKNAFSDCKDQEILKQQLKIFSSLLAPEPGKHRVAGIAWLVQTIGQLSEAGLGRKEIGALVPADIFLGKGHAYVVKSAITGNFDSSKLHIMEKKQHS